MGKRKNMPGYVKKKNVRGHTYWAKDPNYVEKSISDKDVNDSPVEGHVLTYEQAEDEIMGAMDMFASDEARLFMNNWDDYFSQDGWESAGYENSLGRTIKYVKSPSGQVYSLESIGWGEWEDVSEWGVDISPVKDKSYDVEAVTVGMMDYSIDPDAGPEHREFTALVKKKIDGTKGKWFTFDLHDMCYDTDFTKFNVKELPGGDFDGADIPGYKGIQGYDNGSEGHGRVYSTFYSFTLDGQEYVAMSEIPSEDAFVDDDLRMSNGSVHGVFYPVDHTIDAEKMHINNYHYDQHAPTINIPVEEV